MTKRKITSWIIIGLKSTKLLKALKAFKAIKALKPMITVGTMFLSLIVYGFAFGWAFGIGLIAMIFIHEMGHVIAMKKKGYPTKAPVFIPMLGAVIFAPKEMSRTNEAYIGIGGPILGTIGALICWILWYAIPSHPTILLLVSFLGIYINLFNMVPISPLDGGRITQAVGPWFKWVGIISLMTITLLLQDPGLLLIWIIVMMDFNKIKFMKRYYLALGVYIIMLFAILLGLGSELRWVYWLDFGIATFYMALLSGMTFADKVGREKYEKELQEISGVNRDQLDTKKKIFWFANYFVLLAILIACLMIQIKQAEPILKSNNETELSHSKTPPPVIN